MSAACHAASVGTRIVDMNPGWSKLVFNGGWAASAAWRNRVAPSLFTTSAGEVQQVHLPHEI